MLGNFLGILDKSGQKDQLGFLGITFWENWENSPKLWAKMLKTIWNINLIQSALENIDPSASFYVYSNLVRQKLEILEKNPKTKNSKKSQNVIFSYTREPNRSFWNFHEK